MTIKDTLFDALGPLVGNRVYPNTFPQAPSSDGAPRWPCVRFLLSTVPTASLCGDSGDADSDYRVQLDVVAETHAAMHVLRLSIIGVMATFDPPAILEDEFEGYDAETKTHRMVMTYTVYPSSA